MGKLQKVTNLFIKLIFFNSMLERSKTIDVSLREGCRLFLQHLFTATVLQMADGSEHLSQKAYI